MSVVSAAWAGVGAASPAMRGILCLLCGIFFLTISDSLAKWLGGTYAPVQLLFLRGSLAVPIMLVLILALAGRPALRTRYPGLHLFRGFLNVVSASFFYYGLTQLPLAENTAIAFSAPLFVTLLSVLYLKEQVDGRRWAAVIAGFAGVMIVVQPGGPAFQPAALFPLATAFGYAVMMVSARGIGREEGLLTTMFYIALAQVIVAGAVVAWFWQPINQEIHWLGLTGMAICSTAGLGLITQAFRIAPASVVAPFDYSGLLWAGIFGWLFWDEVPGWIACLGAALIAASGIYIAWRESRAGGRQDAQTT